MLVINTSRKTIHEYDSDSGLGTCIAESFSDFLEVYRNELLGAKLEFIEVCLMLLSLIYFFLSNL